MAGVKHIAVFYHDDSIPCQNLLEPLQGMSFDNVSFINVKDEQNRNYAVRNNINQIPAVIIIYNDHRSETLTGLPDCQSVFAPVLEAWQEQVASSQPPQPVAPPNGFVSLSSLPDIPEQPPTFGGNDGGSSSGNGGGSSYSVPPSTETIKPPLPTGAVASMQSSSSGKATIIDKGSSDRPPSLGMPAGALKKSGLIPM